jgi:PPK2 family polyphosphate:nucleotide phosphotransferase
MRDLGLPLRAKDRGPALEMNMDYRERFFVDPKKPLKLGDFDPAYKGGYDSQQAATEDAERYLKMLKHQQTLMYAGKKRSLLIVLQAMDAGGKDGTVGKVFTAFDPQGVSVTSFKEPTPLELAHDFLWRIHPHAPAKGFAAIFNRSHYEDVLVTRVHKLIDKATCINRYARIRDFETLLIENGTEVLKFFLHISKEEQLARFEKRLDDPERNWKISEADYSERALWDEYVEAYEDALSATSAKRAPWYVIPANHKWFRDLAVSRIVADAMKDLDMSFPKPTVDLANIRRKYHAALLAEKDSGKKGGV